jgi:hypothetical protein
VEAGADTEDLGPAVGAGETPSKGKRRDSGELPPKSPSASVVAMPALAEDEDEEAEAGRPAPAAVPVTLFRHLASVPAALTAVPRRGAGSTSGLRLTASMFAGSMSAAATRQLHRCVRVLPQHMDSSGFFLAVFERVSAAAAGDGEGERNASAQPPSSGAGAAQALAESLAVTLTLPPGGGGAEAEEAPGEARALREENATLLEAPGPSTSKQSRAWLFHRLKPSTPEWASVSAFFGLDAKFSTQIVFRDQVRAT